MILLIERKGIMTTRTTLAMAIWLGMLVAVESHAAPPLTVSSGHLIAKQENSEPASQTVLATQKVTRWSPYAEWSVSNNTWDGDPFDVRATVTFVHNASGEKRTTEMFYAGNNTWKFRFTGTRNGEWSFRTQSDGNKGTSREPELHGLSGTILVMEPANHDAHGFIKKFGNKWGWQGTETAFVPQYVMGKELDAFYDEQRHRVDQAKVDREITEFIEEHGFTGFHLPVQARWFDLDGNAKGKPDPDPRTYEVLEALISAVHARGGACHLWMWDTDARGAKNGPRAILGTPMNEIDRRNLRYLAARLGPIPGWSIGYGYDTENLWASPDELTAWKAYLKAHFGWDHFVGTRVGFDESGAYRRSGHKRSKPHLNEKFNAPVGDRFTAWLGGDYIGYTSYRPLYDRYVAVIEHHPDKPSMEEDRFRIRNAKRWTHKDYNAELTRKGLWHSAMAGGVANIWGYLLPDADQGGSRPYDSGNTKIKGIIKTYATFFRDKKRFRKNFLRDNRVSDPRTGTTETPKPADISVCLRDPANKHFVFYKENTDSVGMNLGNMPKSQPAVAVDTKTSYQEIELGLLTPGKHNWKAPYTSDWAIAIGIYP